MYGKGGSAGDRPYLLGTGEYIAHPQPSPAATIHLPEIGATAPWYYWAKCVMILCYEGYFRIRLLRYLQNVAKMQKVPISPFIFAQTHPF